MQTLTLRNSILVALGITACVGTPDDGGDASNSGSDGSSTASSGSTTIVASTTAPGSTTAPESGTSATAGEVSESDASSAGESSSTTGSGGCEPIPQRGTGVPSGFERCEGGVIVRAEPVACPAVDLSTFDVPASCGDNDASCASHEECSDGRGLGICEQSFSPEPNCLCRYTCETDADCDDGSICLCGIEVPDVGSLSVCVPAECSTNDDCEAGLG